ncbi:histidine phosphatase family protein [Microvirga arsenatis]|uniref:Histidine phosphatase family protein n=1 Tax=Microvirga arsenatis TaxID=2692265 RepID=A0ABW9YZI6_9HYPH|nr:histidine phosphatase family protein [Microvirga arsenatis]NBJ25247.1 histidine phosphatase family protein [Microvirga arsenatis]
MTTTFFLVRHAAHDRVGTVLCGRMPGVHLGARGKAQTERLAERFARANVACILSSPLERAVETAEPIAARLGLPFDTCSALAEIDFGRWSGMSFETLAGDPHWTSWNTSRSTNRPPEGETMLETQARIVGIMEDLRRRYAGQSIILVSHSDVIKAALLYHLGLPIDAYARLDVEPASISTLAVGDWGAKIMRLNEVVA